MEWTTKDTLTVVGYLITIGGAIWFLSWQLSGLKSTSQQNNKDIGEVKTELAAHIESFDKHVIDDRLHTTAEQRRDMSRRIDKLEDLIRDSVRDLGVKIDGWAARTLGK